MDLHTRHEKVHYTYSHHLRLHIQLHCADAHTTLREPLGGYYSGQWARLRGYICEEHVLTELRQDHGFPAEGEA